MFDVFSSDATELYLKLLDDRLSRVQSLSKNMSELQQAHYKLENVQSWLTAPILVQFGQEDELKDQTMQYYQISSFVSLHEFIMLTSCYIVCVIPAPS